MRIKLATPILLFVMALGVTAQEVHGVLFDAEFEGGSLGAVRFDSSQNAWIIQLAHDNADAGLPASFRRTFFFRCAQAAGQTLDLRVEGVYWFAGNVAVASYDGLDWFRLDPETNSDVRIFHQMPPDQDQVYFSYTFPYGVSDKNAFLAQVASHPFVSLEEIGKARDFPSIPTEAERIEMITVTNPERAPSGKHGIWIHARIHPGEIQTSFLVEGLVWELLDNADVPSRWLNDHCRFFIVPMANPTGVYSGNYRTNADSINLESVWCSATEFGEPSPYPEVDALKSTLDRLNSEAEPVAIALNLHATMTQVGQGHFHFKHLFPSVSQAFEAIQDRWIEGFDQVSRQFNNVNPETSQLNACAFVESYLWNHYDEAVMALTLETMYMTRDTDDGLLEIGDYRQLGAEMAHAVYHYFNGFPVRMTSQGSGPQDLVLIAGKYPVHLNVTTDSGTHALVLPAHSREVMEMTLTQDEPLAIDADRQCWAFLSQRGPSDTLHTIHGDGDVAQQAILPHIPGRDWTGTLVARNLGDETASFEVFADGSETGQSVSVAAHSSIALDVRAMGTDWLRLVGSFPQWRFDEVFARADNVSVSLPLTQQSTTEVILPHVPKDRTHWWLGLCFLNIWDEALHLDLAAYDDDGRVLAEKEDDLEPHVKQVVLLDDYWQDLPQGVSWIHVAGDRPVQGLFLFGTQNGQSLAGLPLNRTLDQHFMLPVLCDTQTAWHGFSLLNPGPQPANLCLEPYSNEGIALESIDLTIGPGQKVTQTLTQLLGTAVHQVGWVRIDSDRGIMAFMLFGPNGFSSIDGCFLPVLEHKARTVVDKSDRAYSEEELK